MGGVTRVLRSADAAPSLRIHRCALPPNGATNRPKPAQPAQPALRAGGAHCGSSEPDAVSGTKRGWRGRLNTEARVVRATPAATPH